MADTPSSASSRLITHHSSIPSQFFQLPWVAKAPWPQSLGAQGPESPLSMRAGGALQRHSAPMALTARPPSAQIGLEHRIRDRTATWADYPRRNRFGPCSSQRRNHAGSRPPRSLQQTAARTLNWVAPYPNCASDGTTVGFPPFFRCTAWIPGFLASCSSRASRPS